MGHSSIYIGICCDGGRLERGTHGFSGKLMKRLKDKKGVWKLKQLIQTQAYQFNENHLGIDPEGLMPFSLNKGNRRIKRGVYRREFTK